MTQKGFTSSQAASRPAIPEIAPQTGNTQLALNYFTSGLLGLLGPQKNDPEVRYHSFHALFTALGFLALHALFGILGGNFLLLQALADLGASGFSIFQIYRAYQGQPIEVPIISAIARKQAEPSGSVNQTLQ